jgi:kumamolisin
MPTRTPTPGTGTQQVISNGGFENGTSPWSESSTGGYEIVVNTLAHSGSYSAWLCGYQSCDDQIWQTFNVPANFTGATLKYWTYIASNSAGTQTCRDYFYVRLKTTSGTVISIPQQLCNANASGWVSRSINVALALSPYKGNSVIIQFEGTSTSLTDSSFFVDDVSLTLN